MTAKNCCQLPPLAVMPWQWQLFCQCLGPEEAIPLTRVKVARDGKQFFDLARFLNALVATRQANAVLPDRNVGNLTPEIFQ